ncbi:unnamed protein product [Caretta caretta]
MGLWLLVLLVLQAANNCDVAIVNSFSGMFLWDWMHISEKETASLPYMLDMIWI